MFEKLHLTKWFPVPRYLEMPACGLDVSGECIKYTQLERRGGKLYITKYGEANLPKGLIDAGRVTDMEKFTAVLSELKSQHGLNYVHVSLPEDIVFVARMELPTRRSREIRPSIELHLEEHIPLSVKDTVFDYEIVESDTNKKGVDVVVTAASYDAVVEYYRALLDAGLTPLALEPETHATARALVDPDDATTHMIVDIGGLHTSFSIVRGGVVLFGSSVAIGGESITKAIMEDMKVSLEEADKLKKTKGMQRTGGDNALFFSIVRIATILRDEINTRFEYWNKKHEQPDKQISQVILSGGNANVTGIAEYLTSGVNASVTVGNPWTNIFSLSDHIPEIPAEEAMRYGTSLGLSLRNLI